MQLLGLPKDAIYSHVPSLRLTIGKYGFLEVSIKKEITIQFFVSNGYLAGMGQLRYAKFMLGQQLLEVDNFLATCDTLAENGAIFCFFKFSGDKIPDSGMFEIRICGNNLKWFGSIETHDAAIINIPAPQ